MILNIFLVPIVGAFFLPVLGWISVRLRNLAALAFVLASLVFSVMLIPDVLAGRINTISCYLPFGFNIVFTADGLAVFMACVSSFISSIILLYSFGYVSHYKNQTEYYFMVVLFLGAMMGLVFSANLILLYVFWEVTAITSWRLIGFFREKSYILRADKAFLITFFGAVSMLIGFILIYQQAGSFDLGVIKTNLATQPLSWVAISLIMAGILSKSATLPFHTWLPDAGVAPSPVTALLHAAILVKIGVYVFARLFVATLSLPEIWSVIVPSIAAASAIIAAGAAFVETDIKRIIAYSTVSQIGFIFLGLSTGNAMAITGGLLYILMHGLAKAGLFLCAGIVEQNTKIKDITKMGGLIKTMPVTAISFLLCAFSVMGVPPFGGFFSKYMVFAGAIQGKQYYIAALFLVCAVMTILYLFRLFNLVFLGQNKTSSAKEGSVVMVFSVALLAVVSLAAGLFISYPYDFATLATEQMIGIIK